MPLYPLSRGSDFSLLSVLARRSTSFHLLDPALLGMPFVRQLLLLKSYNICYPFTVTYTELLHLLLRITPRHWAY